MAKSALSTTGRGKSGPLIAPSEFEREDARKDSLDEGRWEIGPIAAAATAVIANLDTQIRE